MKKEKLFGKLNFKKIESDADFKEDSVREVIILPILKELGYKQPDIIRSKSLQHPFIKTGSTKKPVTLIPDYCLKVENNFAWVLDAKAPTQKVTDTDHIAQVFSYATHTEIRSKFSDFCIVSIFVNNCRMISNSYCSN